MLLTTQGCVRLRTGPIIMQIPRGYQKKKSLLCRKARYVRSLGKKPNFWPSQRLEKQTGTLSCMHKGPKCIQSLLDHPKKIPFVQKHKEGAICKNWVFSLRIAHIAPFYTINFFFSDSREGFALLLAQCAALRSLA